MIVPALPAASMVVIDDRPDLHVLLGRRRPGAFVGGLVVYPGGAVDEADWQVGPQRLPGASAPGLSADQAAAYLHAAVRETHEEVGLRLDRSEPTDGAGFPPVGHWITPEDAPRRYDTRFFLARHPGGEVWAADDELVDVWWERPATTLERLAVGDLEAIAPTVSFLESLARCGTVADAFAATQRGIQRVFPWGVTTF
jgi:8-oxo-dGTP pyrophosphatase MutT (NUDIX family)